MVSARVVACSLFRKCKRCCYEMSSLPWPQVSRASDVCHAPVDAKPAPLPEGLMEFVCPVKQMSAGPSNMQRTLAAPPHTCLIGDAPGVYAGAAACGDDHAAAATGTGLQDCAVGCQASVVPPCVPTSSQCGAKAKAPTRTLQPPTAADQVNKCRLNLLIDACFQVFGSSYGGFADTDCEACEGVAAAEDVCITCHRVEGGEIVLMCDGCNAVQHLHCGGYGKVPKGMWFCPPCAALPEEERTRLAAQLAAALSAKPKPAPKKARAKPAAAEPRKGRSARYADIWACCLYMLVGCTRIHTSGSQPKLPQRQQLRRRRCPTASGGRRPRWTRSCRLHQSGRAGGQARRPRKRPLQGPLPSWLMRRVRMRVFL